MPIHHRPPPSGLLASARQWSRADASTREQEMHRQRAMAGQPGYPSIGPPQSRTSRIWDHLRHGIPRRVERFLEPETPAEMGGLLAASVMEPAGTAIDVADFAAGFRDRDLPRMLLAGGSAMLPLVSAAGIKGLLRGRGAKAADEYSPVIGGGKLKEARSPRPEEIADAAAEGRQPYSVGLPASRADDGTIFTRRQPAEHGDLINAFDGYEIDLPDGSFVEASFDGSGRGLNRDGWLVDDVFYSVDDVQRIFAPGETPGLLAKAADELPMDEASRMARAEEMGFDKDVYHGTSVPEEITELRPSRTGEFGPGVYTTDTASEAAGYSDMNFPGIVPAGWDKLPTDPRRHRPRIMPLKIKLENPLRITDPDEFWKRFGKKGATDLDAQEAAIEAGYDGIIMTRPQMKPGVWPPTPMGKTIEHQVVFDPKNIRSRFATFDPAQAGSASLIAGGAGLLGAGMARNQRERE